MHSVWRVIRLPIVLTLLFWVEFQGNAQVVPIPDHIMDPAPSRNGAWVAFVREGPSRERGGLASAMNVFVKNRFTGEEYLGSAAHDPEESANGHSSSPSISADGRYVAFESLASNLVAADRNDYADVFIRDLWLGKTRIVTLGHRFNEAADGASGSPVISADGRYVVFSSHARNLVSGDRNDDRDLFRYDLQSGEIQQISPGDQSFFGLFGTFETSRDGSVIAFSAQVGSEISDPAGSVPTELYVWRDAPARLEQFVISEYVVNGERNRLRIDAGEFALSGDGRYLAYRPDVTKRVPAWRGGSVGAFPGYSYDQFRQVMLWDLTTNERSFVGLGTSGAATVFGPMSPNGDIQLDDDGSHLLVRDVALIPRTSTSVSTVYPLSVGDVPGQPFLFRQEVDPPWPNPWRLVELARQNAHGRWGVAVAHEEHSPENRWLYAIDLLTGESREILDLPPGAEFLDPVFAGGSDTFYFETRRDLEGGTPLYEIDGYDYSQDKFFTLREIKPLRLDSPDSYQLGARDRRQVLGTSPITSTVLDGQGRAFAASRSGQVWCLSADWDTVWSVDLADAIVADLAMTPGDDLLVATHGGKLVLLSGRDGSERWRLDQLGTLERGPAVWRESLILGTVEGRVIVADWQTGEVVWNRTVAGSIRSTPSVSGEGKILVGTESEGLLALEISDGTPHWQHEADWVVRGQPVFDRDRVYFGAWDGRLRALDLATGELNWSASFEGPIDSSPLLLDGDTVVVGTVDGMLHCLARASGRLLWQSELKGPLHSTPVTSSLGIIYGFAGSQLWGVRLEDGEPVFDGNLPCNPGCHPRIDSSGRLVIGTIFGDVLGIQLNDGERITKSIWPQFGANAQSRSAFVVGGGIEILEISPLQTAVMGSDLQLSVAVASSRSLSYQWSFRGEDIVGANDASFMIRDVQGADGGIYTVTVTDGVATVDVSTEVRVGFTLEVATLGPGLVAVEPEKPLYFEDETISVRFSASASFADLKRVELDGAVVETRDLEIEMSSNRRVQAVFEVRPAEIPIIQVGEQATASSDPVSDSSGDVYFVLSSRQVRKMDAWLSRTLWESDALGSVGSLLVHQSGNQLLVWERALTILDLDTGAIVRRIPLGDLNRPIALDPAGIVYSRGLEIVTPDEARSLIYAHDLELGSVLWVKDIFDDLGARFTTAEKLALGPDYVLYSEHGRSALLAVDPRTGEHFDSSRGKPWQRTFISGEVLISPAEGIAYVSGVTRQETLGGKTFPLISTVDLAESTLISSFSLPAAPNQSVSDMILGVDGQVFAAHGRVRGNPAYGLSSVSFGDQQVEWSVELDARPLGGLALQSSDTLYVSLNTGELLSVNSADGQFNWRQPVGAPGYNFVFVNKGVTYVRFGNTLRAFADRLDSQEGEFDIDHAKNLDGNLIHSTPGPPQLLRSPVSPVVAVGEASFLTATVNGSLPLHYRWYREGAVMPNERSRWLEFDSIEPGDFGDYTLEVSNQLGTLEIPISLVEGIGLEVEITGGGSVERIPERDFYQPGSEVVLRAVPREDFSFVGWRFDGEMHSDLEITIEVGNSRVHSAFFQSQTPYVPNWRLELDRSQSGPLSVSEDGGLVFVLNRDDVLSAIDVEYGVTVWSAELPFYANRVFVSQGVVIARDNFRMMAFEAATGEQLWERSRIAFWGPVMGNGGEVWVGKTAYSLRNGEILKDLSVAPDLDFVAIGSSDRLFGVSGEVLLGIDSVVDEEIWRYDVAGLRIIQVLASGSWVFLTTATGEVICLREDSGEIAWTQSLDMALDAYSRVSRDGEKLVVLGASGIHALSVNDGAVVWSFEGEELDYGSGQWVEAPSGEIFFSTRTGSIQAFDPELGVLSVDRRVVFNDRGRSHLVSGKLGLLVGFSNQHSLIGFEGGGWVAEIGSPSESLLPTGEGVEGVHDFFVRVAEGDDDEYLIEPSLTIPPGATQWVLDGQPVGRRGERALRLNDGLLSESERMALRLFYSDGSHLDVPVTPDRIRLEFLSRVIGKGRIEASPAKRWFSLGDTVSISAVAEPDWQFRRWRGVDAAPVAELALQMVRPITLQAVFWAPDRAVRWQASNVRPITPPRFRGKETVFYGTETGTARLNAVTGETEWHRMVRRRAAGLVLGPDEGLFSVYENGRIEAIDEATGALRWAVDGPPFARVSRVAPALSARGALIVGRAGRLSAYDSSSGLKLWEVGTDRGSIREVTVSSGGLVFVAAGDGVEAHDSLTGQLVWSVPMRDPSAIPRRDGTVSVVSRESPGSVFWTLSGLSGEGRKQPLPELSSFSGPSVIGLDGAFLVAGFESERGNGIAEVSASGVYRFHPNEFRTTIGGILDDGSVLVNSRWRIERFGFLEDDDRTVLVGDGNFETIPPTLGPDGNLYIGNRSYFGAVDTRLAQGEWPSPSRNLRGTASAEFDGPPEIQAFSEDVIAARGDRAEFRVLAGGSWPMVFQWFHDGELIPGANGESLVIERTVDSDFGAYSVVVSNGLGTASSDEALLREAVTSVETVATGRGSVTVSPAIRFLDPEQVVVLEATPEPGWVFSGWDGVASGGPRIERVVADATTVTARFVREPGVLGLLLPRTFPSHDSHPALSSDGRVFLVSGDSALRSYSLGRSELLWETGTGPRIVHAPLLVGNDSVVVIDSKGTLRSLNAGNGDEMWQQTVLGGGEIPLSLSDDQEVLVGTSLAQLAAIDARDGSLSWQLGLPSAAVTAIAVSGSGRGFFFGEDGRVYAVDTATASIAWRSELLGRFPRQLVLGVGDCVVGSDEVGNLWALDRATGGLRWVIEDVRAKAASLRVGPGNVLVFADIYDRLVVVDGIEGRLLWRGAFGSATGNGIAVSDQGVVYAIEGDQVVATDLTSGTSLWMSPDLDPAPLNLSLTTGGLLIMDSGAGSVSVMASAIETTIETAPWPNKYGRPDNSGRANGSLDSTTDAISIESIEVGSHIVLWVDGLPVGEEVTIASSTDIETWTRQIRVTVDAPQMRFELPLPPLDPGFFRVEVLAEPSSD